MKKIPTLPDPNRAFGKMALFGGSLATVLAFGSAAYGQTFTYLDALSGVGGNTTLSDGSTFTPPLNGTTGADNNWEQRTPFGSSGTIFESGGENVTEDAPELRTTISGLTPGLSYTIYVNFWDPGSTTEDWNIRAGFNSGPGANTLFTAADATGELTGATAAVLASSLSYSTGPTITLESSRNLMAGLVGTTVADANGQIFVFVDDLPTSLNVNRRSWYDGVSFAAVPEPSAFALGGLGLAGLLMFQRKRRN